MTHLADARIIRQMPLHEITARHGERGLHQRFASVVAKFAEAADRPKVRQALDLAGRLPKTPARRRVPDRSSGQTASARADGEAALSAERRSGEPVKLTWS